MDPTQQPTPAPVMSSPQVKRGSSKSRLVIIIALLVLVAAGIAAGVWWYIQDQAAIASQQEDGPSVTITADSYSPDTIRIKAGQEVTWTNTDGGAHELKADTDVLPSFDSGEPLQTGDSYTYTFDATGTYRYYDPANPAKHNGTVIVE